MGICLSEGSICCEDEKGTADDIANELNRVAKSYTENGQEIHADTLRTIGEKIRLLDSQISTSHNVRKYKAMSM